MRGTQLACLCAPRTVSAARNVCYDFQCCNLAHSPYHHTDICTAALLCAATHQAGEDAHVCCCCWLAGAATRRKRRQHLQQVAGQNRIVSSDSRECCCSSIGVVPTCTLMTGQRPMRSCVCSVLDSHAHIARTQDKRNDTARLLELMHCCGDARSDGSGTCVQVLLPAVLLTCDAAERARRNASMPAANGSPQGLKPPRVCCCCWPCCCLLLALAVAAGRGVAPVAAAAAGSGWRTGPAGIPAHKPHERQPQRQH